MTKFSEGDLRFQPEEYQIGGKGNPTETEEVRRVNYGREEENGNHRKVTKKEGKTAFKSGRQGKKSTDDGERPTSVTGARDFLLGHHAR